MNYLITESQVGKLSLTYLNNTYGLEEVRIENHPNIIFFVREGNIYMEYDTENSEIYISNRLKNTLNRTLENIFGLGLLDRHKVINNWIEQYVNLNGNRVYHSESLPYTIKDVLEQ
jgi:hypothetical protein